MPSITYRISLTEAYLKKAQTNWFAHDPKLWRVSLIQNDKVVWASRVGLVGGALFLTLYDGPKLAVITILSIAVLGSFVGTYRMKKARTRAAQKNILLSVSVDENGASTSSQWPAFTRAVAYPDGAMCLWRATG